MTNIIIGSTIIGASGKKLIVDRVEGDTIYSGDLKILPSAILRVIPPRPDAFKLGDRVTYIGTHPSFKEQYGGTLEIWELGRGCDIDKCACLTPAGKVSTWIEYSALQLVEGDLWA